jgi:hypothetical protein
MRPALALPILGVLAFAWVLWHTPIPMPDSRPIIALNKAVKSFRNRGRQELRAKTMGVAAPGLQPVMSLKPPPLRTAAVTSATAGEKQQAIKLPPAKGSVAEAPKLQDEVSQSHDVKVNPAVSAAASLEEAVAKGDRDAPVRLANMYFAGEGVPRSCEEALSLLRTAANKANVRARNRLAAVYAIGICVPRDRVQAYRWLELSLAADPNNVWAQQNRALTWRQMTPEERNLADANQ